MKFPHWAAAVLILGAAAQARASNSLCVLVFERPESPISRVVAGVFDGAPSTDLRMLALPSDIVRCIREQSEEIVIVAHSLEERAGERTDGAVTLGYFRDLRGSERSETLARDLSLFRQKLAAHRAYLATVPLHPKAGKSYPTLRALREVEELEAAIGLYERYPEERPFYVVRPFLPRIMDVARAELAKQAGSGRLRRIRIMSCEPEKVLAAFPVLRALTRENGIELEFAPKSVVWSFFMGKAVTQPDERWLRRSLERER